MDQVHLHAEGYRGGRSRFIPFFLQSPQVYLKTLFLTFPILCWLIPGVAAIQPPNPHGSHQYFWCPTTDPFSQYAFSHPRSQRAAESDLGGISYSCNCKCLNLQVQVHTESHKIIWVGRDLPRRDVSWKRLLRSNLQMPPPEGPAVIHALSADIISQLPISLATRVGC